MGMLGEAAASDCEAHIAVHYGFLVGKQLRAPRSRPIVGQVFLGPTIMPATACGSAAPEKPP